VGEVTELSDDSFDGFLKENPLCVVDFWAPWCGPCRMVGPVLDQLAKEYGGRIAFGKLNIDENDEKASEYGVMSIPTIILVKDGDVTDKIVGALPKDRIKQKLERLL
jgi:thioredoxin 1